jgi:uncharacterized protein
MQISETVRRKYQVLRGSIASMGRVAVTFSGGVDSTLLLKVCIDALGRENVLALTGVSPTYPRAERMEAEAMAADMGARIVMFDSTEMEDKDFVANGRDRCYHCKTRLFRTVRDIARGEGYSLILEGSNADDLNDFRPGRKACLEQDIRSPLLGAGLTKEEIRELSRELGLTTHDKPAQACLSSRIPYGTAITVRRLEEVEQAEAFIKSLGISQVRVRHHGSTARIEVGESDLPFILEERNRIAEELNRIGFAYVALDLRGYRTGSMNEPGPDG